MKKGSLSFGSRQFSDMETGEIIDVQTVYQESSDSNFEKIWLAHLLTGLEELGNKKIQILSYLFRNRIVSHNIVTKTLQEIATETGISYPTVHDTIKILEKNGLITRKTGIIYLAPSMIFKGTHDNRMRILFEFRQIAAERKSSDQEEEPKQLQPAPSLPKQSKPNKVKVKAKAKQGVKK
jgi:DNA-binding transcriptional ArsR family regulator